MINLSGKTREQIERALRNHRRAQLIDVICSLATVEELFTPAEIAARSKMNKRDVLRDMNAGKMGGGYFCRAENSKKASASGVNEWRSRHFVSVSNGKGKA